MSAPRGARPEARNSASAELAAGFELLRRGRADEALRTADALLQARPLDPGGIGLAVEARVALDRPGEALALVESALARGASPRSLLPRKAHVLMAMMRRADARRVAGELAALGQDDPRTRWSAGRIYSRCDDPAGAATEFMAALQAGCDDPELRYDLAAAQFFLGRFADAERHLDEIAARVRLPGDALYLRSTLRRQGPDRNHVADLERRLAGGPHNPLDAAGGWYALAKELEDLGEHERSFAALSRGAGLKRSTLRYDVAAECRAMDAIASAYGAGAVADAVPDASREAPVFVVGLPRTGTTLVERILGRHPDAAPVGELPYFGGVLASAAARAPKAAGAGMAEASLRVDYAELGRAYLAGARQAAASPAPRLVDKMPINFMYCGPIRKALPRARIVHLTRDPMDACYAIYKTLFQGAYHFSYDLRELAAYYAAYRRLMSHWHRVMPEAILDVRYEDLVAEPEREARRVLAWCAMDWRQDVLSSEGDDRPATTASAAQVRGPVHTRSVGSWRKVGRGIEPLRALLEASGIDVA